MERALKDERKLGLICDIDKTFVDTVGNPQAIRGVLASSDAIHSGDNISVGYRSLVYFRPGVREFVANMSQKFHMMLFTLGKRRYAEQIMRVLDPKNQVFQNRLLCADDVTMAGDRNRKSVEKFFPGGSRMVLILDDQVDVWRDASGQVPNALMRVEPVNLFTDNQQNTVWLGDDALSRYAEMLDRVHSEFYENSCADVAIALHNLKLEVFAGCIIAVDCLGTLPANMERIEEFGGQMIPYFRPWATHIIVRSVEDRILREAREYEGIYCVTDDWLLACYYRYERVDEVREEFGIPGIPPITTGAWPRQSEPDEEKDELEQEVRFPESVEEDGEI
jgi:RNA polymerase II subunit A-like phosphatase